LGGVTDGSAARPQCQSLGADIAIVLGSKETQFIGQFCDTEQCSLGLHKNRYDNPDPTYWVDGTVYSGRTLLGYDLYSGQFYTGAIYQDAWFFTFYSHRRMPL
jgi:hypothetical protein